MSNLRSRLLDFWWPALPSALRHGLEEGDFRSRRKFEPRSVNAAPSIVVTQRAAALKISQLPVEQAPRAGCVQVIDKGGRCPPYMLIVKCNIFKNALRAAFCERGAFDCRHPTRRGDTPRL
jgi:hypothetical protein